MPRVVRLVKEPARAYHANGIDFDSLDCPQQDTIAPEMILTNNIGRRRNTSAVHTNYKSRSLQLVVAEIPHLSGGTKRR